MPHPPPDQFEAFRASELWCPTCRRAQPVRENLLLILPGGNKYDYRCAVCGSSLGERSDNDRSAFDILSPDAPGRSL